MDLADKAGRSDTFAFLHQMHLLLFRTKNGCKKLTNPIERSSLQMIYPPSVLQVVLTGLIDTLYDNMPCANKVWNSVFKGVCYLFLLREAPTALSRSTWSC